MHDTIFLFLFVSYHYERVIDSIFTKNSFYFHLVCFVIFYSSRNLQPKLWYQLKGIKPNSQPVCFLYFLFLTSWEFSLIPYKLTLQFISCSHPINFISKKHPYNRFYNFIHQIFNIYIYIYIYIYILYIINMYRIWQNIK